MPRSKASIAILVTVLAAATACPGQEKYSLAQGRPAAADQDNRPGKSIKPVAPVMIGEVMEAERANLPADARPAAAANFRATLPSRINNRAPSNWAKGRAKSKDSALGSDRSEVEVRLPRDIENPVLRMDLTGDFRIKMPDDFKPSPLLEVYADGRVFTGRKSNLVKEVEGQIDAVELQSMMDFVANDCRFFDITSAMLKKDMAANQAGLMRDAALTEIVVRLAKQDHSVSIYGLPNAVGDLSNVASGASVTAVTAIASRCRQLIATTRLGTNEEADAVLAAINKKARLQSNDIPPFSLDHIHYAEQFTDHRRTAAFIQEFRGEGKSQLAFANYQMDSDGNEFVEVHIAETPTR